jgi:uncharacterized protein
MSKRALMIWGGWAGHEPEACTEIFATLLRKAGLEVQIADDLAVLCDESAMRDLALIVPMWTMGSIDKEQSQALKQAVRDGCGLGGWHGGMGDAFRQDVGYQFMTGGQWVVHPGGANVTYTVNITDHQHPITAGLPDFQLTSEQYYMHVDPSNRVLATTTFAGDQEAIDWIAGTVMPVAWTRSYGKGRVFYSSVGHIAKDFDEPTARELVRRGLLWAAGEES